MPWPPPQIIIQQRQHAQYKWNDSKVFESVNVKKHIGIKMKELTYHPIRVGRNPEGNRNIMTNLTNILTGTVCNNDRNSKCWNYHRNAQWPPHHAPAYIFQKPENDVEVFHFSIMQGNVVGSIFHAGMFEKQI